MITELTIGTGGGKIIFPSVKEGISWVTSRKGTAGKLTFTALANGLEQVSEGNPVMLRVNGKGVFCGYIFSVTANQAGEMSFTCYDQIRYLKNKDTYIYENKTAAQLLRMICSDFGLRTGEIENTKFLITSRVEEHVTLIDMIETALGLTRQNTGESYVLYDDFGSLCLKNTKSMYVKKDNAYLLIDEESGESYEYSSSIDKGSYNRVVLSYNGQKAGKREIYSVSDKENIKKWGILQYTASVKKGENGAAKANQLLKLYNKKSQGLKIGGVEGNLNVRGGSIAAIALKAGTTPFYGFMTVERAVHIFEESRHYMNLEMGEAADPPK